MKKIAFYLLILSLMTLQAAVYKGRTAYIGFCKDCHGNGTKMAKAYTSDQWHNMFSKKGAVLAKMHLDAASSIAQRIAEKQAEGLLPYTTLKTVKEYFQNRSEIILKSMTRSEKKAAKGRIYKYQSRHLKDFFVEFSKDSGKVPACSDDNSGGESKAEQEQARRIQEAERQRRAKKAEREKAKLLLAQTRAKQARAQQEAASAKKVRQEAAKQARLKKEQAAQAKADRIAKQKAARIAKEKARKEAAKKKAAEQRISQKELASHKRNSKLTINEQIVKLVEGKLSEKDLNQLKILLLSR